ncbi:MAG: thymidine phosphorylase [Bacilli bacterium]|nr:thymidine phosphorylase [Bacilli bacterium]
MNIKDIIIKKKDKKELTKEEIKYVIDNYMNDNIKDYQMSSLLMAILLNGMTFDETYNLTNEMLNSGDRIDLSKIDGIKVDKHSTGGVGDKTSFVVLPLVAASGVKIAKMSGRGLGYTGGTIDKLESISGFKINLSEQEFIDQVNNINLALVSQSGNLVPADKKIYALRDVTGTTDSVPLIASSIMSKKLASGADKILLDVKVGKGAFMKNIDDARELAKTMVEIGKRFNKETVALLTNMDYPLGNTIGNGLEVEEAIEVLEGNGNKNFTNLCLLLSSYMVSMGKNISIDEAFDIVREKFDNKEGLKKLYEFVSYQGGDLKNIKKEENYISIISNKTGYINDIDTLYLSKLCNDLGAGRKKKEDVINYGVGVKLLKSINDKVNKDDEIMRVYTNKEIDYNEYLKTVIIGEEKKHDIKLVYEVIK